MCGLQLQTDKMASPLRREASEFKTGKKEGVPGTKKKKGGVMGIV